MVANTKRFARFPLLHYRVVQALVALSNPNKTVKIPLLQGQAAGQLQLIYGKFPPEGFLQNSVPARFTVDLEMKWRTAFELHLMVELIGGEDPHTFVLGLISHDQWQKLCEELPVQADKVDILERWVGIVYSPIRREGNAFLSRKLHNLLLETGLE